MDEDAAMEPVLEVHGRAGERDGRPAGRHGVRSRSRPRRRTYSASQAQGHHAEHADGPRPPGLENAFNMLDPLNVLPMLFDDHALVRRQDQVPFSVIRADEMANGPSDRWFFESVQAVRVEPGEDLGAAIREHAKISLKPGAIYEITASIVVTGACYIIGNSAILRVNVPNGAPVFTIANSEPIPAVGFMERICLANIMFVNGGSSKAVCCMSTRNILIHGCVFSGAHMLCLDMRAGAEVRGCQFVGTVCAVRSRGFYNLRVKNCTFERCVFGVVADTKVAISHCFFGDCCCAIKMALTGSVTHSQVIITNRQLAPMNIQLCTCEEHGSHVRPLGNVHVCSHPEAPWPKFQSNTFNRVRVYLGKRRGVFHPRNCLFGLSIIAAPAGVAQQTYFFGVFDGTCAVIQLTEGEEDAGERLCTCGERHMTPLMQASYIVDTRVNRELNSHDTAEYSSSDEEDYY
ncbi:large T-antigen [bat adenovirus 3]|uniref:E1B 55 kDa protein n=1 Tax=bat adenovirus 3 TaxID=2758098 RepID=D3X7B0_9ADEN|nr:large T-antigen [bat adenovirus 3]ADD17099.1 large T-antigen [bat adenovirus 3]